MDSSLDQYWATYDAGDTGTTSTHIIPTIVIPDYPQYDYNYYRYPQTYYYSVRNTTEEAFKILKIMVEEKLVKEPTSFKKFCDLVERIAKVVGG